MAAISKLKLLATRKAAEGTSAIAPGAAPAADDDLPIPSDINAVFLGGLFVLAVLVLCYVAAEIVLPIVLAFVLSLVLQPAMRALGTDTSAARDRGHAHYPGPVWHSWRVGGSAVGAGGKLGAGVARRHSQIAGTAELSQSADCGD
jgi:hypothetical protein